MTKTVNNFSVLIVDDCVEICKIMSSLLTNHGYKTYCAYNGQEGVIQAQEIIPDIILMDFHMPVMNGLEAMQLLKSNNTTKEIPIIMITSCLEKGSDALKSGCFAYEIKPITSKNLLERINEALHTIHKI